LRGGAVPPASRSSAAGQSIPFLQSILGAPFVLATGGGGNVSFPFGRYGFFRVILATSGVASGKAMTKADIVQAVYGKLGGFSKKESADLVDLVFETMKETLGRGEKIKVSGFGNFVLRDKRKRQGRNPQTGDPIVITERRVLSFKASQLLKQALNPKNGGED
jgi:integration host factor subunit alpha